MISNSYTADVIDDPLTTLRSMWSSHDLGIQKRGSPDDRTPSRSPTTPNVVHRWSAPATCGELIQGAIDGQDFMVNCPINLYSVAEATPVIGHGLTMSDSSNFRKVIATLQQLESMRTELHGGILPGVSLRINSPIPRSKGMASSTADASCALAAVAACAGIELDEAAAARLLTAVEPSDCTNFRGIAHLNFLNGQLIERLPVPTGLNVMVVDCGGKVDTAEFDRNRARSIYAQHRNCLHEALQQLKQGLSTRCNQLVGQGATTSTKLSQIILPKRGFHELHALAQGWGVVGINCAHSGTVLGLLFEDGEGMEAHLREQMDREFGVDMPVLGAFRIIGGGNRAV